MLPEKGENASPRALWSWAVYDWANNGFFTLIQTFIFATYFTKSVASDPTLGTTLWGNMMGAAGLVIGLGGPLFGAWADRCGRRKPWVLGCTLLTVGATAMLWFVQPDPSWVVWGLVFVGIGTIGAEYSMIFYNAMLPDLVSSDRIGRWSGWGWAMGYVGGLIGLVVALFGFINEGAFLGISREGAAHVRATCLLSAGWYLLFALPLFLFTPDTPPTGVGLRRGLGEAFTQLVRSVREVRKFKHIARFLVARMIYNDGLVTLFAFGGIYAAGTYGMTAQEVIYFAIGLNVTAGLGAAGFAWLDDHFGAKLVILVSLVGLIVPGVTILLATSKGVLWIFGLALGIFMGPVQAASRSYMARVAPEDVRGEMFGLFAFSGKVTSFLGPLLVGWVTYLTDSQRWGMSVVVFMFILGGAVMLTVPRADQIQK